MNNTNTFNKGFNMMFAEGTLSVGVFFPLEAYSGDTPSMKDQEYLAKLAEDVGFSALWFRDVPLRDPTFGDVGQIYDPFVYLTWIAAHTRQISLATGSIVLPFRHPLHVAKAVSSIDQLSNGRLVLGVASGDRPIEFPAFGIDRESRGELFRMHLSTLQQALQEDCPAFENTYGIMTGFADTIPKPKNKISMLVTGNSQQSLNWIAEHSDGWISYPRPIPQQSKLIEEWRQLIQETGETIFKPFAQSLYVDLCANPNEQGTPIHLGFRSGHKYLRTHLQQLREIGVNHVALNLKYATRPVNEVLQELGEFVLPHFN